MPCGSRSVRRYPPAAVASSTPRIGARGEEREQRVDLDRCAIGQSQRNRPGAGRVRRAAPPPELARREREDLAHGVVELAHAREARGERDLCEAELGRLDQRARRLRALGARERERPGPELGARRAG